MVGLYEPNLSNFVSRLSPAQMANSQSTLDSPQSTQYLNLSVNVNATSLMTFSSLDLSYYFLEVSKDNPHLKTCIFLRLEAPLP